MDIHLILAGQRGASASRKKKAKAGDPEKKTRKGCFF
jgi:hypothetical protein